MPNYQRYTFLTGSTLRVTKWDSLAAACATVCSELMQCLCPFKRSWGFRLKRGRLIEHRSATRTRSRHDLGRV